MTQAEQRSLALSAVRDFLRSHLLDPLKFSGEEALEVLDHVVEAQPDSIAAQWEYAADHMQYACFYQEWEVWRKEGNI